MKIKEMKEKKQIGACLEKEELETMKQAWLVRWGFHAEKEDECLKRAGIDDKIVDVLSVRKNFSDIIEIAKDIYKRKMFSFSQKAYLSNYSRGKQRGKEFFGVSTPVFTSYNSDVYQNFRKALNEGRDDTEIRELRNKVIKYPRCVIVGYNPQLEIIKVFNLSIYQGAYGNEIIEWDEPLTDGSFRREKYELKNN